MSRNRFTDALNALEKQDRLRSLSPRGGLDFASNDYLGLANHPKIKHALITALEQGVSVGSGAARLLRGNHGAHEALESFAADYFSSEAALYMTTGYLANFAIFTTLTQRGDVVFYDELSHASTREGIYASKAAHFAVSHNDATAFEDAIAAWRKGNTGQIWIAVESLYSMDGDCAPLAELAVIAARYDAMLVVDEAHATGVHGSNGRGFAEAFAHLENLIVVHTCGKALGAQGALICCSKTLAQYLINKARPFVFSTAPSPLIAHAVQTALQLVADEPERREQLRTLYAYARGRLPALGGGARAATQILPVIIGPDAAALSIADTLQHQGFDVRAIRPPTVAEGTARLRISITLNVTMDDVIALMDALDRVLLQTAAQ